MKPVIFWMHCHKQDLPEPEGAVNWIFYGGVFFPHSLSVSLVVGTSSDNALHAPCSVHTYSHGLCMNPTPV